MLKKRTHPRQGRTGVHVLAAVNVTASWNPHGRHLLNGNARHNDYVFVWEPTGRLLAGRSELSGVVYINIAQIQRPSKLSTKPVAAVAAQQHVEDNTQRT